MMEKHRGVTLWFTGLSGSGKTTVAEELERNLNHYGILVERLDGDLMREYLTRDLGFTQKDRDENIRRCSYVASLLTRNGIVTLCCFISPYRKARDEARKLIGDFVEVYVNAPLTVCEKRDTKGLYAEARAGRLSSFTGISDPYEPPLNPDIELRTDQETVDESVIKVLDYLEQNGYIYRGYADLHLHTTASDGALAPSQVVKNAKDLGFRCIAITDHDSTEGIDEALHAGKQLGIEVIPGIELSTIDGKREIHILGYFIDQTNQRLQTVLAEMISTRQNRSKQMVEKLKLMGVDISLVRVKEISGGPFIGRPHIARAMLEKGYIKDIKEAFSKEYIGRGGKAYVERYEIRPQEAIALIQEASGVAVLAHPGYLSDGTSLNEEDIAHYVSNGVKGLEVYYSRHTLQQVYCYKNIAHKYNLIITGGSDCHGGEDLIMGCVRLPYLCDLK